MGTDTKIEWAHHTWNPWYGCTPVSEGCAHCYALRRMTQLKRVSGPGEIRRASKAVQRFPLSKKVRSGDRVFVCSWSDFFHEDVYDIYNAPDHTTATWREGALEVMLQRPDVHFLLLTKRAHEMAMWASAILSDWDGPEYYDYGKYVLGPIQHIWLGFTAENQARFDERWKAMEDLSWPGKTFLSYEPAVGSLVLPKGALADPLQGALDWVIAGGESGPNARPANPEWFRGVRDACVEAGVPFFFKQWGDWLPGGIKDGFPTWPHGEPLARMRNFTAHAWDGDFSFRIGKKRAGRVLDGRTWEEVPQ